MPPGPGLGVARKGHRSSQGAAVDSRSVVGNVVEMDRGGDDGADDLDAHHDHSFGADDLTADPVGTAPRQWTHPSEMGLQARVHTDRRRSRALVVALVAIGAGVLLGTAAMAAVFSRSERTDSAASAPAPLEGCLALVDVIDADGSDELTGLLVDDGRHVLVAGDGLEAADRLAVRIGGSRTTGTVVAQDPYADLALLSLESLSGSRPEMSPRPSVGDPLRIVHFDTAGHRRSSQVRVQDVAMTWSRPDHTVADDVMVLSGDVADSGVLVDPSGAVAGLVIGAAEGRSVAYDSDVLQSLVERLRSGGTIEHAWIGVRAGDVAVDSDRSGTPVGELPAPTAPGGATVIEVLPESPAEAAGIVAGDVITAVDDRPVTEMADLVDAVASLSPGHAITVTVVRDGQVAGVPLRVAAFPG